MKRCNKRFLVVINAFFLGFFLGCQYSLTDAVSLQHNPPPLLPEDGASAVLPTKDDKTDLVGFVKANDGGKRQWNFWAAVAYEEVGHPLVAKGDSFFDHARELYFTGENPLIDEFLEVYKNRPDPVNLCGIRINHAMALFLAVKKLEPTLVVESGVNSGVSTYFIRQASPTTRIFAVDPLAKPICNQGERWIDTSGNLTTYFTGSDFVDILDMDWKGMAERKEFDPLTTLVFLDDHLHAFDRTVGMMAHGIRHILVEDNYKPGEGATLLDKRSTPKQMFSGHRGWMHKGEWLWKYVTTYSEFPPLVPPIVAKEYTGPRKPAGGFMVASDSNEDIVSPILRPDMLPLDEASYHKITNYLGIDPSLKDLLSYMQMMNYNQFCYLELLPEAAAAASTAPK